MLMTPSCTCLSDIKSWMAQNFLKVNVKKSEVILFGPPNYVSSIISNLDNLSDNITQTARNLGVIFASNLSFDAQAKHVVQFCFFPA